MSTAETVHQDARARSRPAWCCGTAVAMGLVTVIVGLLTLGLATPVSATRPEGPAQPVLDRLIPLGDGFAAPVRSPKDCRRWRAVAARLGETYAGFRLRQTVVARVCAFTEETADDDHWSWPWRDAELRAELPPRLHALFGDWQVRCGRAGRRSRCVLAVSSALLGSPDPDQDDLPLMAHFVIDQVGGREVLLWRLHVVADIVRTGGLDVVLGKRRTNETFDVCGRIGCIVETETRLSTDAANWLWDGKSIGVRLGVAGPGEFRAILPATGFRAGLAELMRLRRLETRSLAGR